MKQLIKPQRLKAGDTIATVSLSSGRAGDEGVLWRYYQGKKRLEQLFGLKVVEMPHTLSGSEFLYKNPRARAEDLNAAFSDTEIKAVISCIGGEETMRLLQHVDFKAIRNNPKIFLGYSDTTVNHFMCYKAGITSFYGAAVLTDFAENVAMSDYTVKWLQKTLFSTDAPGKIPTSEGYTDEYLAWSESNKNIARKYKPNDGYKVVCGHGKVRGRLIGGCIEVFDWLRGTLIYPDIEDFDGAILFLESSEEKPLPSNYLYMLRSLGAMGVLARINGIILGKPRGNTYYNEYNEMIIRVLNEFGRADLPVLANASFGHNEPKMCIPYGVEAELDCEAAEFSIAESGVV